MRHLRLRCACVHLNKTCAGRGEAFSRKKVEDNDNPLFPFAARRKANALRAQFSTPSSQNAFELHVFSPAFDDFFYENVACHSCTRCRLRRRDDASRSIAPTRKCRVDEKEETHTLEQKGVFEVEKQFLQMPVCGLFKGSRCSRSARSRC